MRALFPSEWLEREAKMKAELEELNTTIPIFVCTMLFPQMPCPLHIFEPRYRLMIRRCMDSGTKRFGMVAYIGNGFAQYGTTSGINPVNFFDEAEIASVQMLSDGRSFVDTHGGRRFKIREHSIKDGYVVAKVEWIDDTEEPEDQEAIKQLVATLRTHVDSWLSNLSSHKRQKFFESYGNVPEDPCKFSFWLSTIMPIDDRFKVPILAITSVKERLEKLNEIVQSIH